MTASSNTSGVAQDVFLGGLQAQFDATKATVQQYRAALNCRVRKNAIEPSFKHVKLTAPSGLKQAIFAQDDSLLLLVAGDVYVLNTSGRFNRVGTTGLSTTADVIYWCNVPAPTNLFVGPNKTYTSKISTTPLIAVLQDSVKQPVLASPALGIRTAKTYDQWTYEEPEYVPVGRRMAFTGAKLYIESPDGLKEYHSVSGRPLDFVLAFDDTTGAKKGNADTTATAVATAKLTALVPAQNGGFVAATKYRVHAVIPMTNFLVWGEPYLYPRELFQAGVVGQNSFVQIAGETIFVGPTGIQKFDQIAQFNFESNLSPFGAPISALIKKPITKAACASADDYAFFGVDTIFGPGILVFDIQLGVFVGVDLTQGNVKEFALLADDAGLTHVYYITDSDEVFELPLYSGERNMASIYFGEWAPVGRDGQADVTLRHRLKSVTLGLTNVKSDGYVTVRPFVDRVEEEMHVVPITATGSPQLGTPTRFPFAGEFPSEIYPVNFTFPQRGYALGIRVDIAVDARLAALTVETDTFPLDAQRILAPQEVERYVVFGRCKADARYTADFSAVTGRTYQLEAGSTLAGRALSGSERIMLRPGGHIARQFAAGADRVFIYNNAIAYDYTSLAAEFRDNALGNFVLGNIEATDTYGAFFKLFTEQNQPIYAMAGDLEQATTARAKDFFGHGGQPRYYMVAGRDADFYCMSFPPSGTLPNELEPDGEYARWLRAAIQARASESPNRINVLLTPISPIDNAQLATWAFDQIDLACIITVTTGAYQRTTVSGIPLLAIGQDGTHLDVETVPRSLELTYTDANGNQDYLSIVV